jgi:subtilisin-like proprotein convertase family protein
MKFSSFILSLVLICAAALAASAQTTFTNSSPITINDETIATPYPSNIAVSGLTGNVTKVRVTINGLNHTWPDDVGMLLVGPTGVKVRLMSDVGRGNALANVNLTFDDTGNPLPDTTAITSGTYRPTQGNGGGGEGPPHPANFAPPAPPAPYSLSLADFNNVNPNGTWSLYVDDDGPDDVGSISGGWSLTITTSGGGTPTPTPDAPIDFNGDGRTDYVVVRNVGGASGSGGSPANQMRWFYNFNVAPPIPATQARDWGLASDVFLSEDFDGDFKDDIAVWRSGGSGVAAFYILNSATNTARIEQFGLAGDNPKVVGDYDGDNKADVAVYRPGATAGAQSTWLYRTTPGGATNSIVWGRGDDLPVPGDYDGDGKHDFVIQRNNGDGRGQFWTRLATGATTTPVRVFGLVNDFIAPGDYDGDGKTDLAAVRISGGAYQWHWRRSSDSVEIGPITFGVAATDLLAPGDYDGDGRMDIAVWRRTGGLFISRSTVSGAVSFFQLGADGDFPVAGYNVHFRPLIL